MRTPTNIDQAFAWWRAALNAIEQPITHEPQCGFYRRRFVREGPWVGARIWLEQQIDSETGELAADEHLRCEVNGEPRDAVNEWTYLANNPISEEEYNFLRDRYRWSRQYAPEEPAANPSQPVDHLRTPLPF